MRCSDFTLSTVPFKGSKNLGKIYYENPAYIDEHNDAILFFKGELFEPSLSMDDLYHVIRSSGIDAVSGFKGEFLIAYYDGNNRVSFATDKISPMKIYYYLNDGEFIVSTDFWSIVEIIRPSEKDIDDEALKELIILRKPLMERTFIKKLYMLEGGKIVYLDLSSMKIKSTKYWGLRFTGRVDDVDEAVELLDESISRTVSRITSSNRDASFGVGISGGLDSRIIPYYLFKHGAKRIIGFIIGEKKPSGLFLSRDHVSARKIARYYGIPLYEIEYDSEDLKRKLILDVRCNPCYTSNALRTSLFDNFDILVTGGYGAIVGGHILSEKLNNMTSEELAAFILRKFSLVHSRAHPTDIVTYFKYLLRNLSRRKGSRESGKRLFFNVPGLISADDLKNSYSKLLKYVVEEEKKGKSNIEIFMEYHLNLSNKHGAFESLSCRKEAYSIYYPYTLEYVLDWNPRLLIGRRVLEKLILKISPELASIPSQSSEPPIIFRYRRIGRFRKRIINYYYKIMGKLRGRGLNYYKWRYNEKFQQLVKEILSIPNPIFTRYFDPDSLLSNPDLHPSVIETLLKVKYMLDIIYYRRFDQLHSIDKVLCGGSRKQDETRMS